MQLAKGTVVGSQGALRGPDSPPFTTQYVYTTERQFFYVISLRSSTFV